jgi:solute:Na+ symporter, SSS family
LHAIDWVVVVLYCVTALSLGLYFTRRGSKGLEEFFMGGRSLTWWAIGISTVAAFSPSGTASSFIMLVFTFGLLGNWWWWLPWIIWMPLVAVIWSKFWRRLKIVSTAELIEVRYGGQAASIFRSVAAVYFSFGWAVILIGYVTAWLTQSIGPILGWSNMSIFLFAGVLTLIYTMSAGLLGVVYSEVFQFAFFLAANLVFLFVLVYRLGGLGSIYARAHQVGGHAFFQATLPGGPFTKLTVLALILQGLFFASSPTGGEGFTAQKFMAAKNEFHAQVGQLFSSVLSLVVRVIPFVFMGVIALVVFPHRDVPAAQAWGKLVKLFGFEGLTGLLVASELAAYQASISTDLNWGASYLVNDLYKRLVARNASNRHIVWAGRLATVLLLVTALLAGYFLVSGMMAWFLFINNVMVAFFLPLAWLRFFWWRMNIWGEITGVVGSLPLGYFIWFTLDYAHKPFWQGFLLLFAAGWIAILTVTLITPPEKPDVLTDFYRRCKPPGFWGKITDSLPLDERRRLKAELWQDIYDCALTVTVCAASVVSMAEFFGQHWIAGVIAVAVGLPASWVFVRRWKEKGVFESLGEPGEASAPLGVE